MAKWTEKEIKDFINYRGDKELIKVDKRVPKKLVGIVELAKEVALDAGITQKDTRLVIDSFIKILGRHLYDGDSIKLEKLATFFTYVKPPYFHQGRYKKKHVNNMVIQPRRKVRFKLNKDLKYAIEEKEIKLEEAYELLNSYLIKPNKNKNEKNG